MNTSAPRLAASSRTTAAGVRSFCGSAPRAELLGAGFVMRDRAVSGALIYAGVPPVAANATGTPTIAAVSLALPPARSPADTGRHASAAALRRR